VCLDETSKQFLAETRLPIPMKRGRPARCDYEYERNGTASPTDPMFRINSVTVIKTAIQLLPQPWINDFEFARLAPSQKKASRPLATAWHDQIANQIAQRLGEKKVEAA
jgi:hypothetical protein